MNRLPARSVFERWDRGLLELPFTQSNDFFLQAMEIYAQEWSELGYPQYGAIYRAIVRVLQSSDWQDENWTPLAQALADTPELKSFQREAHVLSQGWRRLPSERRRKFLTHLCYSMHREAEREKLAREFDSGERI